MTRSARVLALLAFSSGVAWSGWPSPAYAQRAAAPDTQPGIEVQQYDFTLDLPDTGGFIRGVARIRIRRTAGTDSLRLDLIGLSVDSVAVDGQPVRAGRTATQLMVPLPPVRSAGGAVVPGTFAVTVAFSGEPHDGFIIRTDSAGRWTGFGDNWPNRARYWIPTVDHPSKKAPVTWTVRAPASRTVVANGELVSARGAPGSALGGPRTVTTWRERRPIATYLMVIAAAPLVAYDLGETACGHAALSACVHQTVYVAPEQRRVLPGAFSSAGEIVKYFAELVAPFPYEKLAHLQSSTRFGGMENASEIFYADDEFRRQGMSDALIAHETAHQWFGDAVTERDWPHLWLSEGFATYFAALWTRRARGDSAFREDMRTMREAVLADTTAVPKRPVIDSIETNLLALLNRNSYEKGGFVLHMLRRTLGDSVFFSALRAYYAAHRDGNAVTADVQTAMERASGQRLGWFFDQWLRRPGYPILDAAWEYDGASRRVAVTVNQDPTFGMFRFPLTVEVALGGRVRRAVVEIAAQERTRVTLPLELAASPSAVRFDPDVDLLARIRSKQP